MPLKLHDRTVLYTHTGIKIANHVEFSIGYYYTLVCKFIHDSFVYRPGEQITFSL